MNSTKPVDTETTPFLHPSTPALPSWYMSIRALTPKEHDLLINNNNSFSSWETVRVADPFDPKLIRNSTFCGTMVIGPQTDGVLNHNSITLPIGIYNSHLTDCTIGANVAIHHLHYCSRYIIGDETIILNTGELSSSTNARFGNGAIVNSSQLHRYVGLINENGGRSVIPFEGMLCSDAWIWAKARHDSELMKKLQEITDSTGSSLAGAFGTVGEKSIILNTKAIRDFRTGSFALIDSAEFISNVTMRSDSTERSTIGAGVQVIDSIIGFGNTIDSGAQLSATITGTNVSVSKTARIYETFIGDNSSISCCEIGHSLICPSHGQHHNNSFLIATMIGGQCNIAAGATIGSNHNSRMNDGELWANRGFWPGLCVSFKHNSRFASFCMAAKGDYPSELTIPFPFTLIMNDPSKDQLILFPAFWFTNNMYAFMRSCNKFTKRDKRIHKDQFIEYDGLAPDTVDEIIQACKLIETYVGREQFIQEGNSDADNDELCRSRGFELLQKKPFNSELQELKIHGIERGRRTVVLKNVAHAWSMYRSMVYFYSVKTLVLDTSMQSFTLLVNRKQGDSADKKWVNVGGQLFREDQIEELFVSIKTDISINSWDAIHNKYRGYQEKYIELKKDHAANCLAWLENFSQQKFNETLYREILLKTVPICETICRLTRSSRERDYLDSYRKMTYDTAEEMKAVTGSIEDDTVIQQVTSDMVTLQNKIRLLLDE